MTKLSYSAINIYATCGEKYRLRYKTNLRSKYTHAALLFGSAIDGALNKLLLTKDLEASKQEFDKLWAFQWINKKYEALQENTNLVYAETDFDKELLTQDDFDKMYDFTESKNIYINFTDFDGSYKDILEEKKSKGWPNLLEEKQKFYNYCNWLSMSRKGHIMLDSYNKKIISQIKEVLVVQKENYLQNSDGDQVVQYLDLIATWKDGRNILFDNKTSARDYDDDSASRSPQLISYYHGAKEEYKLEAVGFFVLKKQIQKNRIKICSLCGYDGSGARHKTCSNERQGDRCNGEWNETISPECFIQVIINDVAQASESLVLSSFDEANKGIKSESYYKNLSACKQGSLICEYFGLCWKGDKSELVEVEK